MKKNNQKSLKHNILIYTQLLKAKTYFGLNLHASKKILNKHIIEALTVYKQS